MQNAGYESGQCTNTNPSIRVGQYRRDRPYLHAVPEMEWTKQVN